MDHECIKSITSIVQAIASLLIPIVVIYLGRKINRQLEKNKVSLSKEKEWQTKWADSFFSSASEFNRTTEELVMLIYQLANPLKNDSHDAVKDKEKLIWLTLEKMQHAEWSLKTHVQFASKNRDAVLANTSKIMSLCEKLFKEKAINLEEIREALFNFNATSKSAHSELLAL